MTIWFLAFLGLIWALVVMPTIVRQHRSSPLPASQRFRSAMRQIGPPQPPRRKRVSRTARPNRRYMVLPKEDERLREISWHRKQLQRRRILGVSAIGLLGCVAGAIVWGGAWVSYALIASAIVLAYVGFLIEGQRRRLERISKVRRLPHSSARSFDSELRLADGS